MSTYYTSKYSGEQIDEAVKKIMDGEMTGDYADRQLSNLDTPQAALANLGAGVRPNIADNGNLIDAVNQRQFTSTTQSGMILDRWEISSDATINVTYTKGNGLLLQNLGSTGNLFLVQKWERKLEEEKKYTLSVLTDKGLFSDSLSPGEPSYPTSGLYFSVVNWSGYGVFKIGVLSGGNSFLVKYVKIEDGEGQTLAYQDEDGAWQLLPQPESDYATQLAKCQRYLYSPYYGAATTTPIGAVFVRNPTTGFVQVDLPNQMRIKPVFFGKQHKLWIVKSDGGEAQRPSELSVMGMSGCAVFMSVTASFDTGGSYIMYSEDVSNPSDFLLSAEL